MMGGVQNELASLVEYMKVGGLCLTPAREISSIINTGSSCHLWVDERAQKLYYCMKMTHTHNA